MSQPLQPLSVNEYLRQHIRTVPDWPAPGVQFRDITPLLQDPKVFRVLIDAFVHRYMDKALRPDVVAGLDARGFILGAVVAYELNVGFVPIRKKGKLPFTTVEETYELEYGSATVELHTDAVKAGDRVLLIDDLIATGGTMMGQKTAGEAGRYRDRRRRHCGLARARWLRPFARVGALALYPGGLRGPLTPRHSPQLPASG